ncbi:MAG: chemotaxis protein CheW [Rhizobacter sp.]|nr:chemotaxis protein CheW [Rhizobacter sp.]
MNTAVRDRPVASAASKVQAEDGVQYLTFMLAGEMFAIGILAIKEIIEFQTLTEVPMMPPCVRGVINLRGAVVPVMDMLARFGRRTPPVTKRTCIVIMEVESEGEHQVVGVIVDAVSEVLDIAPSDIQPPPTFGAGVRTDFISGMGRIKEKFVILLDINRVIAIDEIGGLLESNAAIAAERPMALAA